MNKKFKKSIGPIIITLVCILLIIGFYFALPKNKPLAWPITYQDDSIIINRPAPSSYISSPLNVNGQARGNWFFEGNFLVILTDWDGRIIAEGFALAEGEGTGEDFVPFMGRVVFDKPAYGKNGILIFQKNNPSGLPENDEAVEIPIFFK